MAEVRYEFAGDQDDDKRFWFHSKVFVQSAKAKKATYWRVLSWCRANLPACAWDSYYGGDLIEIHNETAAIAFRMRWC
jgi:hypothetical protein